MNITTVSVGVATNITNISIPSDNDISGTPGLAPETGPSTEDPQPNF